jgi:hypothetical protein
MKQLLSGPQTGSSVDANHEQLCVEAHWNVVSLNRCTFLFAKSKLGTIVSCGMVMNKMTKEKTNKDRP